MLLFIALILWPAALTSCLSPDVSELLSDYWDWRLSDMPEFASFVGVHDYDDRLDDMSEEAFEKRNVKCLEFRDRADSLFMFNFTRPADDYQNYDEFISEVETYINGYQYQGFLAPLCYSEGIHIDLENLIGFMNFMTIDDYNMLLSRYQKLPLRLKQLEDLMRAGVEQGIVNHNISMKGVVKGLQRFVVESAEDSPMWGPMTNMSDTSMTQEEIDQIKSLATEVIMQVTPSFGVLMNYVASEYVTRPEIGVTTLPDGKNRYDAILRFHTSTDLTPAKIHQMGKDEVERITQEMAKIIVDLGYSNMSVPDFSNMIRDDPDNYYDSPKELLEGFQDIVHNQITPLMPDIFLNVPKAELEVVAQPSPSGPAAYYIGGAFDGSRPGIFYVNTYIYDQAPKYTMMTLALHEGNPGHHLQGSYSIEDPSMPYYRRTTEDRHYSYSPSRFPLTTAYIEGWALYSENLGFDLGLYDDLLVRYGHYSMEIFRACRLVVDTGLHAFGWTRQEAIDYMLNNSAETEANVHNEIDRYITWPGQATAYKIGELKITELRNFATEELGGDFVLKEFHDIVLQLVGPLDILEKGVYDWVQTKKNNRD